MNIESRLHSIASGMEYPPTPNIAGPVAARLRSLTRPRFISRKFAWSLTIVLVLLSSLMLIPTARAAIIEFIQIGVVRIFPRPTESPSVVIRTATPEVITPLTATSVASLPSSLPKLDNIAGETKLATAQEMTPYTILLPTYPSGLGQPNHVYIQDVEGVMTILVWVDSQESKRVTMSLHIIPRGSWAINKMNPAVIEETQVEGQRAIWAEGPYPLILRNGNIEFTRMIYGHVLIWTDGDITYRLETDLSLEEATKIAESLEPIR